MLEEQTRHPVRALAFGLLATCQSDPKSSKKQGVVEASKFSVAAADRLKHYAVCRVQDSGRLRACLSFPYKLEQVRIDDIFVSGAHAVGKSRVDLQGGSFHNFR